MPEKYRSGINWTLALAIMISAVKGVWILSTMASDVSGVRAELMGIRSDFRVIQTKVQELDTRTSRLEERAHVSGDFHDHTKGGNR